MKIEVQVIPHKGNKGSSSSYQDKPGNLNFCLDKAFYFKTFSSILHSKTPYYSNRKCCIIQL